MHISSSFHSVHMRFISWGFIQDFFMGVKTATCEGGGGVTRSMQICLFLLGDTNSMAPLYETVSWLFLSLRANTYLQEDWKGRGRTQF